MVYCYIIVFLFGCISAFAELTSRYGRFDQMFKYLASYSYFLLNGSAALFAYWYINAYNLDFGSFTKNEFGKILLAGTSSMIILRSSIASIKNGNKNFETGLGAITQVFLNATDRSFDRKRSIEDYSEIETIMKDVDFKKAKKDIAITCLSLMKNVSEEEQQLLANDIIRLEKDTRSNKAKAITLGVLISRTAGIDLLRKVVESFRDTISLNSDVSVESEKEKKLNELLIKFE